MTIGLKRFAAVLSTRWREPSSCEGCGSQFTCGATLGGCWCSEIKLSDEQRAKLKDLYRRCLCSECLRAIAASPGTSEKAEGILATNPGE